MISTDTIRRSWNRFQQIDLIVNSINKAFTTKLCWCKENIKKTITTNSKHSHNFSLILKFKCISFSLRIKSTYLSLALLSHMVGHECISRVGQGKANRCPFGTRKEKCLFQTALNCCEKTMFTKSSVFPMLSRRFPEKPPVIVAFLIMILSLKTAPAFLLKASCFRNRYCSCGFLKNLTKKKVFLE